MVKLEEFIKEKIKINKKLVNQVAGTIELTTICNAKEDDDPICNNAGKSGNELVNAV